MVQNQTSISFMFQRISTSAARSFKYSKTCLNRFTIWHSHHNRLVHNIKLNDLRASNNGSVASPRKNFTTPTLQRCSYGTARSISMLMQGHMHPSLPFRTPPRKLGFRRVISALWDVGWWRQFTEIAKTRSRVNVFPWRFHHSRPTIFSWNTNMLVWSRRWSGHIIHWATSHIQVSRVGYARANFSNFRPNFEPSEIWKSRKFSSNEVRPILRLCYKLTTSPLRCTWIPSSFSSGTSLSHTFCPVVIVGIHRLLNTKLHRVGPRPCLKASIFL